MRAAQYARYARSLETISKEPVPGHVAAQMLDSKTHKTLLFPRCAASVCNWAKTVVMAKLARIKETDDEETHAWLTHAQTRDLHKTH